MAGFKLGIVRLGQAAGKIKYALLDEKDISLVQNFVFEACTETDQDGTGARVYAYAYNIHSGRSSGQHLHEIIWERHSGGIAPGYKIIHKNGVTVDNRLDNLCVVPEHFKAVACTDTEMSSKYGQNESLYSIAVQQLHCLEPVHQHVQESVFTTPLDRDGDPVSEEVAVSEYGSVLFYECHYPPCTNMENRVMEFSICGKCKTVRYCSVGCQQRDWSVHKQLCREIIRPDITEYLDR